MPVEQQDCKNTLAAKVPAGPDDDEGRLLIERVKAGDHQAFEALFSRYLGPVYRQGMRLLADQAEAEEAVQTEHVRRFLQQRRPGELFSENVVEADEGQDHSRPR